MQDLNLASVSLALRLGGDDLTFQICDGRRHASQLGSKGANFQSGLM